MKAYGLAVKIMSVVFVVIGVAVVILTLSRGGGPLSLGVILGVLFIAIGVIRYRFQDRLGDGS